MNERAFWLHYFGVEAGDRRRLGVDPDAPPRTVKLRVRVSPLYALHFDVDGCNVDLHLHRLGAARRCLGWNDSAHWTPHALRWDETRAICQALSRLGAEYQHPGIPLLLLTLFTPVTDEDDYGAILNEASEALSVTSLFTDRQIDRLAPRMLREFDEGARWKRTTLGYVLVGDAPVHSLRREGGEFPFDDLQAMLASTSGWPLARS